MWRFCILLLIVGSLLFAEEINISSEVEENEKLQDFLTYTPLSRAQAIAYIDNPANREQLIKDVIRLDAIEHIPLRLMMPNYTALLNEDDDLIIFPQTEIGKAQLYDLGWEFKYPTYTITDFGVGICPKWNWKSFFIGLGIGTLSGVLIGIFAE